MKFRLILFMAGMAIGHVSMAQSKVDNVLASVAANNKTIQAHAQYWEAQKLGYKTGLSPIDPIVGFDYMIGSPATAGNQTDFTVTQSLDFPTAYVKKQQLSDQQAMQAEWQLLGTRRDVLLEAKKVCIDLVYRQRLQMQLQQRLARAERLRQDFQTKMDKGEGNILDLNKARLQLVAMRRESQENLSAIAVLNAQLAALNGGNAVEFTDTIYPPVTEIASFESLEKEIEATDPMRQTLEQEINISRKELEVSKALKLPRLEVGYHYQGILGQTYNGVHTGISLPLWEHRNTTQARQAEMAMAGLELQDHVNAHFYEVKELYQRYTTLGVTLEEYRALLTDLNSEALLAKALSLGQISVIEYFMELAYYYGAYDNLLMVEREFQQVMAELLKYRL